MPLSYFGLWEAVIITPDNPVIYDLIAAKIPVLKQTLSRRSPNVLNPAVPYDILFVTFGNILSNSKIFVIMGGKVFSWES